MVLAACLLFLSFEEKPDLISALDTRGVDSMFRLRGAIPTTGRVVIVDIDEKSLAALGQWPWPRDTVARLVDSIGGAGARVVGFDVVFAEQDRSSPVNVLERMNKETPGSVMAEQLERTKGNPALDHDVLLGKAVSRSPSVLGYVFLLQDDGLKDPLAFPFPSINIRTQPENIAFDALSLIPAYRAIINIPAVAQATSEGFFNFLPDATGMAHKVPLFMEMDNIPYPSLALEMVRIGEKLPEAILHVSQLIRNGRQGILGVSIGERTIITDDYGQMTINYRGPIGSFPYLSAVDVLAGSGVERLQDKYVLIGTTAAGLHDLRATPFSTIFPGVEIQATIIDNILSGDLMTHDPIAERGLTFMLMIVGGLSLSALLAYGSPVYGGIGTLLILGATLASNYYLYFLKNVIIGLTYPLIVILTVFPIVTLVNYLLVGREKRFIDMAFGHYVSPHVVEELKKNPDKLTLAGEERVLSIMFSDIRGFTSISEQMSADQLGRFMNRYLTAMSRVIMDHGGTVDKFIGDAIMAIWNAPLEDEDHAASSVRATLAMMKSFRALQPGWAAEGLPAFGIGIGINSGLVSVGNFGSEDRFDYTVLGDHVNLASRLEGLTKQYEVPIIISEFTRQALGERFFCRLLDRVRVKGKGHPVEIYEPLLEGVPGEELKAEVDSFQGALERYFHRDFTAAEQMIQELNNRSPQPLYLLYLKRIAAFIENPPKSDWNGVTSLTEK